MSEDLHVFLSVSVADGGLPCTAAPPINATRECIPTDDHAIMSGYVCASACPEGTVAVSVYQCQDGGWDEDPVCLDAKNTLTCRCANNHILQQCANLFVSQIDFYDVFYMPRLIINLFVVQVVVSM